MNDKRRRSANLIALLAVLASPATTATRVSASEATTLFSFAGQGCKQTVSNIEAPRERVAPYMDDRFHCSREELGVCMVAYRMFECPALSIDRGNGPEEPRRVIWTELGVRARPPHGIPNTDHIDTHAMDGHDYYMLFFHTSDEELSSLLESAGAPTLHVADANDLRFDGDSMPPTFFGLEIVRGGGGTYEIEVQSLLPEEESQLAARLILEGGAFPPFHLNGYHSPSGAPGAPILRYREYRTEVTGHLSSYLIRHSDGSDPGDPTGVTLLGQFTGRPETRFRDAFVLFDIDASVEIFDDPECVFDPTCNPANLPHH